MVSNYFLAICRMGGGVSGHDPDLSKNIRDLPFHGSRPASGRPCITGIVEG